MDQITAHTSLTALSLPVGFTGSLRQLEDGSYAVHVDGPQGWMCEYSLPGGADWASAQIAAAAGV
jgi:hypothetical protein